jgi:parallel beta-helix repeat protein
MLLAVLALTIVPVESWAVTNAVTGTCKAGSQFTSVQAAINAADAGSTVQVCPGTYPEILTITKNLTVKGVAAGKNNDVVISVPSTGVPPNQTNGIFGKLASQVYILKAVVNLSNITIDGGGGTTCTPDVHQVGVLFQAAGGSMMNSSVVDPPQCGEPISAFLDLTSNFKFTNNYLSACYGICVEVDYGSNTTVTNNLMNSLTTAFTGIEVQQLGGPATISGNILGGGYYFSIESQNSSAVTITDNTMSVGPGGYGVGVFAGTQVVISGNKASGGYAGIYLDDNSVTGGNTVTKNTVINATCGFNPATTNLGDTVSGNMYFSVTTSTCPFTPV